MLLSINLSRLYIRPVLSSRFRADLEADLGVRFASVRRFSKSAIRNPNRSEKIPPNPPKIEVFLSIDLEPIWRPGIARSLVIHFGHGGRINTKPKTPPQPHCHSPSSLLPHPSQRPLRLGHCTPLICSYSPALRPNTSAVCPQLRQQSAPPSLQRLPINATSSGPLSSLAIVWQWSGPVVDLSTRTIEKVCRVAEVCAPLPIHKWGSGRITAVCLTPTPNT